MEELFHHLQSIQPTAHALLLICAVAATGLALGSIKVRGLSIGIAGVLFTGILFGHLGGHIEPELRAFLQEFGLILFVYSIGMQLGPSFFSSLKKQGLRLNLLAVAIVVSGVLTTIFLGYLWGFDFAGAAGLFAGATTNTPALGAAQQALGQSAGERSALPALAYAVAYPMGITGILVSMVVLKGWCRVDLSHEALEAQKERQLEKQPVEAWSIKIENQNLEGITVRELPGKQEWGLVFSRLQTASEEDPFVPHSDTILHVGDILVVVGEQSKLEQFQRAVGKIAETDLTSQSTHLRSERVIVTSKEVIGKTLAQLALRPRYNVSVTRIMRGDVEMTSIPHLKLQFGDSLRIVGDVEHLKQVATLLGNAHQALDETRFVPLFVGIGLGILAGLIPIGLPGIPAPVKLGLAGGPLLVAIILGYLGNVGSLVWHIPMNANRAFRELGVTLFLACVGLKAGEQFFTTVFTTRGVLWLLSGMVITMLPLLVVGFFARKVLKINYITLLGVMAGSMTDPPALAFAHTMIGSSEASVAYATVYPLTMVLRILFAQLLILLFT